MSIFYVCTEFCDSLSLIRGLNGMSIWLSELRWQFSDLWESALTVRRKSCQVAWLVCFTLLTVFFMPRPGSLFLEASRPARQNPYPGFPFSVFNGEYYWLSKYCFLSSLVKPLCTFQGGSSSQSYSSSERRWHLCFATFTREREKQVNVLTI